MKEQNFHLIYDSDVAAEHIFHIDSDNEAIIR